MAHPDREESVDRIRDSLDRDVRVSWDGKVKPSPRPEQRWRNGANAWDMVDRTADYGLVLQDDVLVTQDFIAGVELALDTLGPQGLVSAYTGTGRPEQAVVQRAIHHAKHHRSPWAQMRSLCWGPAIIAPTDTIDQMLEWCSQRKHANKNYDFRIGLYYRDVVGWKTFYLVPSLVEHAQMPSLVGHDDGPKRVAHDFLGVDRSALEIDYSRLPFGGLSPWL